MTYDLRRLRARDFITRIPHTHRCRITDHGLRTAMFLSAVHDRFLPTGLAHLAEHATSPPLRAASRAYPNGPRKSQPHNRTRHVTPQTEPDNTKLDSKTRLRRVKRS
jgi:hypothetical protein